MIPANNKAIVLAALKQLIGARNPDVTDTYVHDSYIQHSPLVKDGKTGLQEALQQLKKMPAAPAPATSPVVRSIEDGHFVMIHMDVAFMGKKMAVVDLYRLEGGKLAEHWDATQEQPGEVNITHGATTIEDLAQTVENKQLVAAFYRQPDAALLAPDFVSHDPLYTSPGLFDQLTVHRILGEGNFVMVQCSAERNGVNMVVYDIFRAKNHLLAEHWRVVQVIPAVMPHPNGMI
ncbi:nuclear transport factor 2 family protein [Chitinophaga sp. 22321]|uniref:Nuclear transport factor 2 family protein n=1 Tax=Chitinophaga hostae TaxID=2831022 RepID=A0ABS5IZ47_9BACT|nr:nuclear transport factor 2 family protein [Chitinophaga hostae]MBS0028135.1 nuclear transport factor 2 family protein [Chitinophaga hostae]